MTAWAGVFLWAGKAKDSVAFFQNSQPTSLRLAAAPSLPTSWARSSSVSTFSLVARATSAESAASAASSSDTLEASADLAW